MNIVNSITSLIGNTPLIKLHSCIDAGSNTVVAKLEQLNPGGSVKDRAALAMVDEAEKNGKLLPGGTIVEATSGNTGIALALVAAARKYKACIVMPETMSIERKQLLAAFGAEVVLTPAHLGMKGSIDKANELGRQITGAYVIGQFDNPANPDVHTVTTAQEIIDSTDGQVKVFIAGVGTGGTVTGVGRGLKKFNPAIRIIAVEPKTSNVLSGGRGGPHLIQGIGAGFIPTIYDSGVVDEVIAVSDDEAYLWTRKVIQGEGILTGVSSGASLAATAKYITKHSPENELIVTLFPDTGERYLSLPQLFKEN